MKDKEANVLRVQSLEEEVSAQKKKFLGVQKFLGQIEDAAAKEIELTTQLDEAKQLMLCAVR